MPQFQLKIINLQQLSLNPKIHIDLANGLFNGTVSTIAELCKGNIYMAGMISMVDNLNRILDRVAAYLG